MFLHNYIYRLKCIIKDKEFLFWTLLFPIILATLFNFAFSNITEAEKFTRLNIAVVDNEEFRQNTALQRAIKAAANSSGDKDREGLFNIRYTSKEEGDKLLEDREIEGYIYLDNGIKLVVKESGLSQSIIKGFMDHFMQLSSTLETIIRKDPQSMERGILDKAEAAINYLKEVAPSKSSPDIVVNYFYNLIAMACMYGGFWGLKEVTVIQANLSSQGARINIAPIHKFKIFIVCVLAAVTVQLFEILLLLAYLALVLKISFGNQIGYIIFTCIVGTITGVTFGAFVASVVKKGEGVKIGILIGSSMTMSFLAGMMYDKMKYIISTKVPVIGYLNPANLITDCFYSLYYYGINTRFFINIGVLCVFIVFFSLCTYLILRRQKYASL
ncbi:MAG: ABC transporter permease [Caldicoprobacterales bacterium]